jgi:predicted AAA+ superfamily ATPase
VIAAGSLLEFALRDFEYSMPVGRVSFAFVEPMTFPEFLQAHRQERLLQRLMEWTPGLPLGDAAHAMAMEFYDRYLMTGGMPEVVAADAAGAQASECRRLQRDLIQTYRNDFAKYSGRMEPRILDDVLRGVVDQLGNKFVYSLVEAGVKHQQAKHALDLLCMAQLCDSIPHADCNGVPLAGKINERLRKLALLDVGLAHALWNTPAGNSFPRWTDVVPALRGGLAEQGVAQQLRAAMGEPTRRGHLFHWRRENGRVGEIDLVVECHGRIVPVETKSGAAGAMKSLHQFMHDKSLPLAVRVDRNPPSLQKMEIKTTLGDPVEYQLVNIPHYLAWRTPALINCLQ